MSENIISALIVFLKGEATVTDLAGTRIYGVELPRSESASAPRPSVVLRPSGGTSFASGTYIRHDTQRIDVSCYGETLFEADKLRDAVRDVFGEMRRSKIGSTLIHWVDPAGGWTSNRDTDLDWPVAFQSFQAFYALEAAA